VEEYQRETVNHGAKYATDHNVLDQLLDIYYGTSILLLDETFSEAQKLLNIVLNNYSKTSQGNYFEIVPYSNQRTDGRVISIGDQSLTDISISLNELRRKNRKTSIIHTALPDMIIENDPDDILRLLMNWQKNIRESNTVEFYILPKGTFQELERKILSVVDGGIEIRVDNTEGRFRSFLRPIRCCKPDYHLKEFQYMINKGRLLLRWDERFTDEFASFDVEEIQRRIIDYRKNLRFLKVIRGGKTDPQVSVYDYWMLSQLQDKHLAEIQEIFPEEFDNILEKIAAWQIADALRVVRAEEPWRYPNAKKSKVGGRVKLALDLPLWLTNRLLRLRTGQPRTIPLDAFMANRKASLAFIDMLLAKLDLKEVDYMDRLMEMQKRFNEMGTRETAIKHTKLLGENLFLKIDLDYLPKILSLTFSSTYNIKPRVNRVSEKEFIVEFRECVECAGMTFSKPVCSAIEGIIEGICGVIFKSGVKCRETECKALGDETCVFKLEFD
jgi:predicted hydrocarbon binding protein